MFLEDSFELKISWTYKQAFRRLKVRSKVEIVTMGVNGVDPKIDSGFYVDSSDWNNYLNDPQTLVIDTRNNYEISIGSFEGSVNPKTETFREFPVWVDKYLRSLVDKIKPRRIAPSAAVNPQLRVVLRWYAIQLPINLPSFPPTNSGVIKYPIAKTNTNNPPALIPGIV